MQNLPIGMQSFRAVREANYLYVDKTKWLHRLGYPNKEVEESFLDYILPKYMTTTENKSFTYIKTL